MLRTKQKEAQYVYTHIECLIEYLTRIAQELVDNSVDEALADFAENIK